MAFIKNKQCEVLKLPLAIHSEICAKFSPPALVEVRGRASLYSHPPRLWGGVRGRASELAGGVIISNDKPPPASAKALAPPLKRGVR